MPTKQGDLSLLNDPIAQELLHSKIPARLAYVWRDRTPRVISSWFHWNGQEVVLGTSPTSPKTKVLPHDLKVALTIDTNAWPFKVVLIRRTAKVETVTGMIPEYGL